MSVRVLVTAAGGALSPLNIRLMKQCRGGKAWVLGVDAREGAAGRYFADAFAVVPNGDDPGYGDAIVACVRDHAIDLVLPWSDEEALALAAARPRIEAAGARLACAELETLQLMSDKARSYDLLGEAGIVLPQWHLATCPQTLAQAVDVFRTAGKDFAVKPVRARGNRGTIVVRADAGEAEAYLGSRELHMSADVFMREHVADVPLPAMVMERLFPPAYDIDVLAQDGKLLRAMPRRRLNPAGVPFAGGVLEPRDDLMELAEKITSALNLSWLYDYDIMTTSDGVAVPLELNPRPSGSIASAILAGVPFYEDLIALVRGEALAPVDLPRDVTVIPHLDCIVVNGEESASS